MTIKQLVVCIFLALFTTSAIAQAKKPTIMVVPSDDWCISKNFTMRFNNQGTQQIFPDYQRALRENSDLNGVISKIGELMIDRGFPLVDLGSQLDKIEKDKARTNMFDIRESPIDILNKTAKADIILKVFWKLHTQGPKKSIEFRLQGIDSYTSKQVAAASGTGHFSFTQQLSILLEEAVLTHLDNFNFQLMNHFEDLFANGRQGALVLYVSENASINFDSKYNLKGREAALKEIINRYWMPRNTVEGRFSLEENSQNVLKFSQVRIPLYGDDGWGGQMAYDFATWGANLKQFLTDEFSINTKIQTKGLGEVELIIQ
jgi:hypothetical protein